LTIKVSAGLAAEVERQLRRPAQELRDPELVVVIVAVTELPIRARTGPMD
jgi:hypothetical protein